MRRDERETLRLLLDALDLPRTGLAEIPSDPPGDATDQATDAAVDRAIAEIRELVLRWFGADAADPPAANELEALLQAAVDGMDFDAYAAALTDAELVVPVDGTDWLIVTDAQTRVVAAFTSAELLDTVAPGNRPRRRVPMATLAAEWPAPDVVLCLNPGARTELVLLPEELTTFITGR